MEFIVHMPININLEGPLGQTWDAFHQKFKYYQRTELQRTALAEVSSLLLFAAHHQIEALCTALNVYDMNFSKLNAILQVVEETCMPYFILLFERFRYFSLSHNILSQEEEQTNTLQQQVEICEFTNLKEGVLTHALCGSLKNSVLLQHLSDPDGIHMDDIKALYNEIEKAQHSEENASNNKDHVSSVVEPIYTVEEMLAKKTSKNIHEIKTVEEIQDVFSDDKNLTSTFEVTVEVVNLPISENKDVTTLLKDTSKDIEGVTTKLIDTSANVKAPATKRKDISKIVKALTSRLKDTSKDVKTPTTKLKDTSKNVKAPTTKLKDTSKNVKSPTTKIKDTSKNVKAPTTKLKDTSKNVKAPTTKLKDTSKNVKAPTNKLKGVSKVVKASTPKLKDTSKSVKAPTTKLNNTLGVVEKENPIASESDEKGPRKRFYCCFCNKSFVGGACLRRHLTKTHNGDQGYPCWICQTTYPDVEEYLSLFHWSTVHSSARLNPNGLQSELKGISFKRKYVRLSSFPCTTCNQVFSQRRILQAHIKRDHCRSYMCWCCGQNFNIIADYKIHLAEHLTTRTFSCDLCQRQSSSLTGLFYHLHKHMVPRVKCHICGYSFIKSETLAKHVEEHVTGPAHTCNICGKSFVTNFRLRLHMSSHTGEKKYVCELCGKSYTDRNNLRNHKRWHTGEKPNKCDYCGKAFRCSGDLSKHRRKHYDKLAFVCDVCGRGFSYKHGLVRHRLKHSGKRSYACKVCGRTFIYNSGLTDHIKANRCPGKNKGVNDFNDMVVEIEILNDV